MKRSNPSTFSALKAVFLCFILISAAKTAFAQITLDLDVLEEPSTQKSVPETTAEKKSDDVRSPEKKPSESAKEAKKAVPAVKPVPAKKPVKPVVAKPVVKQTVRTGEKYQVKESRPKDEHDKLKPHAAPVPKVKILTARNSESGTEEDYLFDNDVRKVRSGKEPRISKHFLEQQRLKSERGRKRDIASEQVETAEREQPRPVTPQQLKTAAEEAGTAITASNEKTEIKEVKDAVPAKTREPEKKKQVEITKPAGKAPQAEEHKPENAVTEKPVEEPVFAFSVFPVSETLTPAERSASLAKEIPAESATFKALSDKKALHDVFRFEKKAIELTPEMQTELDKVAVLLKKDRKKRLVLYAYASEDITEPGKERQYALRRALMVRSYLIVQGIHSLRIELRSQGQKGAGDRIPDRTDLVFQDK